MNEGTLTKQMRDYIAERGGYVEKIWGGGFQASGIPDLVGCYRGRFIAFEVKLDYNKPSAIQKAKLQMISMAGGYGIVAYKLDQVKDVLDQIDDEVDIYRKVFENQILPEGDENK